MLQGDAVASAADAGAACCLRYPVPTMPPAPCAGRRGWCNGSTTSSLSGANPASDRTRRLSAGLSYETGRKQRELMAEALNIYL